MMKRYEIFYVTSPLNLLSRRGDLVTSFQLLYYLIQQ